MTDQPQTTERQSGRTSRQMLAAPLGAVFVWPVSASVDYAFRLAAHLDRSDLIIASPSDNPRRAVLRHIVLDHAFSEHVYGRAWRDWHEAMEAANVQ